MFFNFPLIAIDIGTSAIKIVELSGRDTSRRLVNMGIEILPPGAVQDGEIREQQLVVKSIRNLIERLGIKTKRRRVALSVSGNAVIVKRIIVNSDDDVEIGELLFEQAKQHFHHDMEDMYFRYQLLESSFVTENEMAAIIVAAKIGVIEQYVEIVHELGMKVGVIDCDVLCLANMFEFNYPIADALTVAVNIGAYSTQIVLSFNGEFIFNREFYMGGDQVTMRIAEAMGVEFENAESIKLSASNGDNTLIDQVRPAIADTIQLITSEVTATIDFFLQSEEFPDQIKAVGYVYLSGGAAQTLDLAQSISSAVKAPVQIINPFQRVDTGSDDGEIDTLLSQGPLYGVAVGLGLRQFNDTD